jgi:hypothetical protein
VIAGRAVAIDERRWTYEQIAKQTEREDNLNQTRLNSCIVVNLALLAAVATQINLSDFGLKNLVIILGCSAAGYLITDGIRGSIADGDTQLEYLRTRFFKLRDRDRSIDPEGKLEPLVRPFMSDEDSDREYVPRPWTSITLVFMRMWVAIAIVALLLFLISLALREGTIWQRLTSMLS